jgi:hypothetical protein
MKLLGYILALSTAFITLTTAQIRDTPADFPKMELEVDSNNLELFIWKYYEEGEKLTFERFTDPAPTELGKPTKGADFSKYRNYFCRDMPVIAYESHPKMWNGAHLNVCWGVVRPTVEDKDGQNTE